MAGDPAASRVSGRESIPETSQATGTVAEVTGREAPPISRRRLAWSVFAEYAIYLLVGAMLLAALWVNLQVAYFGAGTELIQRFAADAEFILAASAVMLFAFEIRKERRAPK